MQRRAVVGGESGQFNYPTVRVHFCSRLPAESHRKKERCQNAFNVAESPTPIISLIKTQFRLIL